jgi:hypothetical protein
VSALSLAVDRLSARGRLCAGLMLEAGPYVWPLAKRTSQDERATCFDRKGNDEKEALDPTRHDAIRPRSQHDRHTLAYTAAPQLHSLLANCKGHMPLPTTTTATPGLEGCCHATRTTACCNAPCRLGPRPDRATAKCLMRRCICGVDGSEDSMGLI